MKKANWMANITRCTAIIALVLEVFDFFDESLKLKLFESHEADIKKLGILLFLISLVGWLEASNAGLAKLEQMGAQLQSLVADASRIDVVAKYGSSAVWLANLLHPQERDTGRFPHCRAGGETLSHLLLNTYTQIAKEFHELRGGHTNEVELAENSIINLFLKNLVVSLPPKSVWLGISRLQDMGAWEAGSAEASYYEFENEVESRVRRSLLTCLRVLCFDTEERYHSMAEIAARQIETGLHLRSCVNPKMPDDLSLIWIPRANSNTKLDLKDPIRWLEGSTSGFEPLCGISFEIRGDREVYKMRLHAPDTDGFTALKMHFRQSWSASSAYLASAPALYPPTPAALHGRSGGRGGMAGGGARPPVAL